MKKKYVPYNSAAMRYYINEGWVTLWVKGQHAILGLRVH